MNLKVLIVDDEPQAIEVIKNYLENFQNIEIVSSCTTAIEAYQVLRQKQIDLMFLDIQMPALKGTDFLRSLNRPPHVIFTTAYPEYALEGFDLAAVDYLVKPVSFDRFLRAIDKVLKLYEMKSGLSFTAEPSVDKEIFMYLKVDRKTIKINVGDILWIESLKDYVKVVLEDKSYITKQKISVLEELLPPQFVRIHRSFIVSVPKVTSYYSYAVEIGGKELPVGRNYKNEVQRRLRVNF
ncbi:LytTR family two component transcriptional regulator [Arcticibacter tournemirensis]|uniref:Response regulator transcription factor n=1 Tax=Arcticibacter tournemirensis TaxID=699437 RepID=A0A4Q0MD31_9SPHI|nr:LytTR family DNA-binding domain-containing protein [Arcticibacter tournemirensis]KAA8475716.1 response regulator transcription factor [Arcticibacter tournemirensis]RXF71287.1 response regulator transcription factor [Arcticibacter tournemirensis]TQM52313.1 LytTR family two component transcriptional regulator [Arcticibacter tournemirensis]